MTTSRAWSERALNRSTLARQGLLERTDHTVVDTIRRVGGLQAQEPAAPYVALWNRIDGFDPATLDRAFADRTVIRASLLRVTLHVVASDDHAVFHAAMEPVLRAARVNDRRYRATGLTEDDADRLVDPLTAWASQPRTKQQVLDWIDQQRGAATDARMWWALRTYAPLVHTPNDAIWSFDRRQRFEAAPGSGHPIGRGEALRAVAVSYLAAFGPASAADLAQFALLPKSLVRDVLTSCADALVRAVGPGGVELFDLAEATPTTDDTPVPPRLLGMWDQTLLAYADRSRVIADRYRPLVCRRNGDILPTVFVDGHVAGVWRPVENGIEITPFEPWPHQIWDQLESEATSLHRLLAARDPNTFGRFRNWWNKLPVTDRTVVGADIGNRP